MRQGDLLRPVRAEVRASEHPVEHRAPDPRTTAVGRQRPGEVVGARAGELRGQEQHRQDRAAARVGVGVERQGHPVRCGPVEFVEGEPDGGVQVRHVCGAAGRAADADDLVDARGDVRLVATAHVRHVPAPDGGGLGYEGGDLLGRGVQAGDVVEPGREAHRPVRRSLSHERTHGVELLVVGGAVVVAHHLVPDGPGGHERRDVERRRAVVGVEQPGDPAAAVGRVRAVDRGEVPGRVRAVARCRPDAVLPGDDRRDALAQERELHALVEHEGPRVRVRVDEARHDDPVGAVDHRCVGGDTEPFADLGDPAVRDEDVPAVEPAVVADDRPAGEEHRRRHRASAATSRSARVRRPSRSPSRRASPTSGEPRPTATAPAAR